MSRRRSALAAVLPLALALVLGPPPGGSVAPASAQSTATTAPPALLTEPGTWCRASGEVPAELRNCRLSSHASVKVVWNDPALIPAAVADAVIGSTVEGMARYKELGLTAADISALDPVNIAILPGDDSPAYSWKLGWIQIGAVSVAKLVGADKDAGTAARLELWHELFHWIEDENYSMGWARVNGDLTWWQEVSAEMGTFLIDKDAADRNANLYGRSTLDDMRTLVFQLSPFQWATSEQYLQAQLLRVNICPSGCPLTQQTFVAAINAGTYPFSDASARAALRKNLDRYATFVLTGALDAGVSAPFASGGKVGDYVGIDRSESEPFRLLTASYPPQIDKTKRTIEAPLQPDSIYPLLIGSGTAAAGATGTAMRVGQPAMVTIASGTELYYTVDGGAVEHHDGNGPLVIAPIHQNLGTGVIRLVAVARADPATFRATIEPLDLTGDWLFSMKSAKIVDSTCKTEKGGGSDSQKEMLSTLGHYIAPRGSYAIRDERLPGELEWTLDPGKSLADKGGDGETFESTITVGDSGVTMELLLDMPKGGADAGSVIARVHAPEGDTKGAALALALPLGLLVLMRHRRRIVTLVVLAIVAVTLTGCVGIYGSVGATITFTKLEYMGADVPVKKPAWKLTGGTGTMDIDLTVVSETTNAKGKSVQDEQNCRLTVSINAIGQLYADGVLKAPKM